MSLMLRFVRCSPSRLIHESLVSSTAATELPHPEGRSTDALVNDRIHCLVYLPFALQFTICSVPYHCIAVYLSLRLLACIAFLPSSTRRTRSTILENFGFRKLIVSCSMASPIDTDKPGVTPDDDHNGETMINVADATGIPGDASDSEAGGEHQAQNAKGRTPAQEAVSFYRSLACSEVSPILELRLTGGGNHFPLVEIELYTTNDLAIICRPEALEGHLLGS